MKYQIFILGFLSFFFYRCKSPVIEILESNGNEFAICHLDRLSNEVRAYPLSDFIDSCIMVILDNSVSEAFIKDIAEINVSENFIGIRSRGMPNLPYKLFTKDGRFLRNIGTIGKGPDEYLVLSSSQIDERANKIYLTTFGAADKILVYDMEGNSLPEIKLKFVMRKCRTFISNDTVNCFSLPFLGDSAVFLRQTILGEIIDYTSPTPSMISQNYNEEVFSNHNTKNYEFFLTTSKLLMHYEPVSTSLVPKLQIETEKERPLVCWEWPNHYYGWVQSEGYFLINKNNHDANYASLYNDFYGNIDALFSGNRGYFTNWISGIELLSSIKDKSKTGIYDLSLIEIKENVSIDNWVLFLGKLKNYEINN
jgi:hypothetical protein